MKRIVLGSFAILASATLLGGCLGEPMKPGLVTMNCVNTVLDTDAPLPNIVLMKSSDFAARFGGEHNGYFVRAGAQVAAGNRSTDETVLHTAEGTSGTVYLSSRRDASILPHELAHHASVQSGGTIDEEEAEYAARVCGPKTRIAQRY